MKIDPALLSRASGVVEANRRDPLVASRRDSRAHRRADCSPRWRASRRNARRSRCRCCVFHGTADKLTEPDGSREFEANAGSTDSTLAMLEGSYHETLNDLDRDRVIRALIDWTLVRADLRAARM